MINRNNPAKAQVHSRPGLPTQKGPVGLQAVKLSGRKEAALIYVPPSYQPGKPASLAVMFHGAGGKPRDGLGLLQAQADRAGLLLLAPGSEQASWDVLAGGYGPDVSVIDAALEYVFARYNIDPARLAVGGFSDGASYALSLGISNGLLFKEIIAFSPGFMAPTREPDAPRIFISHGTEDRVLPIDACSRQLVPMLRRAGYDVDYHEFAGGHAVPEKIREEAVEWLGR